MISNQPSSASAEVSDQSVMCIQAAYQAARDHRVPADILVALTKTETGIGQNGPVKPWPWSINTEGRGAWLRSRSELLEASLENLADHKTSFDVGCFQINYRWHHREFDSLDAMIEPLSNAKYAAKVLRKLFIEFGSWERAVGAYYSRDSVKAKRYSKAVAGNIQRLGQEQFRDIGNVQVFASPLSLPQRGFSMLFPETGSVSPGSLVRKSKATVSSHLGALVVQ